MILVVTHPSCLFQSPERAAFAKMLLFDERENRSTRRKTSRIKEENQQQTGLTRIWCRLRDLNPGHFDVGDESSHLGQPSFHGSLFLNYKAFSQEQEDPWSINSGLLQFSWRDGR